MNWRLAPTVTSNDNEGTITISNCNIDALRRDLDKQWGTSTIGLYMFKSISWYSVVIYNFFVPDFYFCISKLPEYRYKYTTERTISAILEGIKTNTWFKSYFQPDNIHPILKLKNLSNLKYKLLPPQLGALEAYNEKVPKLKLNGYLLAAAVGSGKTLMGLAIAETLEADVTIIVCPKYLIDSVWVNEITTQYGNKKRIWKSNANLELTNKYDIYIIHYESIEKGIFLFEKYNFKKPCIILDESHNLNDIKTLRTKQYLDMCMISGSKNIIHSSGTPIKAIGNETIPLFRAIDDMFTLDVEECFRNIYKRSASRALEILANRIGLVSHKIPKEAVMEGIPAPLEEDIKIVLPDPGRYILPTLRTELEFFVKERTEFYNKDMHIHIKNYKDGLAIYEPTIRSKKEQEEYELYTEYVKRMRISYDSKTMGYMSSYCNIFEKEKIVPLLPNDLKKDFINSKSVYKYVQLKIMGEFLGQVLVRRRTELHNEMLEHSHIDMIVGTSDKKTICFTNYVDTVLAADDYFRKRKFTPSLVYGATSSNVNSIVNEFKSDPKLNPLIATIQSLSTGVTITEANTCIFLNQPFRSFEKVQASNRIYRIGQDTQTYIYNLLLDTGEVPNLSTRLMDIQQWSKNQVDAMLVEGADETLEASVELFQDFIGKKENNSIFNW